MPVRPSASTTTLPRPTIFVGSTGRSVAHCGAGRFVAHPPHCHEQPRVFDFARPGLRGAEATGTYFARPTEFDPEAHSQGRFHALQGEALTRGGATDSGAGGADGEGALLPAQAVPSVPGDPSPAIFPRRWSPVRTGELLVTLTVMSPENMAAFVRSWGADVKVLHSPALAAHIQGAAQEMLRMGPEAGA